MLFFVFNKILKKFLKKMFTNKNYGAIIQLKLNILTVIYFFDLK